MNNSTFIRIKQVKKKTGLSTATIYRLMQANKFPHSLNICGRSIAWIEAEVQAWIDEKIESNRTEGK